MNFGFGLPEVDTAEIDEKTPWVLEHVGHFLCADGTYHGNKKLAKVFHGRQMAETMKQQLDRPQNGVVHKIVAA
jgi:hypothetical protein